MSTYDNVKAEMGDGPAYPNKADFTTYFGYKAGNPLGTFPDRDAAVKAGAVTIEKNFDKDGYEVARTAYRNHEKMMGDEWRRSVRAEYPEVNDKVFELAMAKAWSDGHAYGHGEVELHLADEIEFALKVIAAATEVG